MYNKTIQMCIFDGDPNRKIMCELSNWNGRVYKISRNELSAFSNRLDADYTGIYFLFGKDEENVETVYIGEAEKIATRLRQHLKDNYYWTDAVTIVSKDNILNKAHVKYLENKFYCLAIDANRSKIINSTIPTCSSLSEFDNAMLEEFIDNAMLLINTLGYKVFDKQSEIENSKDLFYIDAVRGAKALGYISSDGFVVKKGSHIACNVTKSISESLVRLRNKLIESKIVVNDEFMDDYLFSSPSLASSIVLGRNSNGRTDWKTKDKKTIKDIEGI